jgi:hypothetical protein
MSRIYWYYFAIYLAMAAMGVGLIAGGAASAHGTAPVLTGIFITAICLPLLPAFGIGLRPMRISDGNLHVPTAFGSRTIPLSAISGVGLMYRLIPRLTGWTPVVWGQNGLPVQLGRWTVLTWKNPGAKGARKILQVQRDWTAPVDHEDAGYLASTRAGQATTAIYDAALAWQGRTGPLCTQALEKAITYDPNASARLIAWWSPDGSMGRAVGLPAVDRSRFPSSDRMPKGPPRRKRALVIGLGGTILTITIGVALGNVDDAGNAKHPSAVQHGLLALAITMLLVGPVVSIIAGIWTWRHRPALVDDTQAVVNTPPNANTWNQDARSVTSSLPGTPPVSVPQPAPEVQQARRRYLVLILSTALLVIALSILTAVMLNHSVHLSNGEWCAPVLRPASKHPSTACNAWRHQRLIDYAWPASFLGMAVIIFFILQIQAIRSLQRVSRAASTDRHNALSRADSGRTWQ